MVRKKLEYAILGLIIGVILGILLGFGELQWIKKSQRQSFMPLAIGISVLLCACVGYSWGSKTGKEIYVDECLGIDKSEESFYKDGRFWVGITKWIDKRDSKQYQLVTSRHGGNTLVTSLNNHIIYNHGIPNANQQTVPSYHKQSRNQLWKELRDSFTEGKST